MKIFELKRDGVYGIGFIDPNTVNEKVLTTYPKDTEKMLLRFLKALNTKPEIFLPYNFKWVLLLPYFYLLYIYSMLSVVDELCMPAYTNHVCSFHWILLIIRIDDGTIEVLDSLSKDPEEYKSLHSMLDM